MAMQSAQDLFMTQLAEIYDAEQRFLQGQQEMLTNATDPQLQDGIQMHIGQTQQHVQRLDQVFGLLKMQAPKKTNEVATALVSTAQQEMSQAGSGAIRDILIDGAATKVEHFEIASYTSLITAAQLMGQQQVTSLLEQNLQEEEQTAKLLQQVAPQLLQKTMQSGGNDASRMTQATGTRPRDTSGMAASDPYITINDQPLDDTAPHSPS